MHAITVLQPYASAIVFGCKPVENRSWRPPDHLIGQRLWIHAGKSQRLLHEDRPTDGLRWAMVAAGTMRLAGVRWDDPVPRGAIIGSVRLAKVETIDQRPAGCIWSVGPLCWIMEDAVALQEPIPCRGRLGIWSFKAEPFPAR